MDDLVTKGTNEPYRMFTSRAEYRLTLRSDNADLRLTNIGIHYGLVSKIRKQLFLNKKKMLDSAINNIKKLKISPNKLLKHKIKVKLDGKIRSVFDLLSFKNINFRMLETIWPELKKIEPSIKDQIEIESHYKFYLDRQNEEIKSFKKDENLIFPKNFDFNTVGSLSNEVVEKLNLIKPPSLGAASRISGVTPLSYYCTFKTCQKKIQKTKGRINLNTLFEIDMFFTKKYHLKKNQIALYEKFINYLIAWNKNMNLVGKSTLIDPFNSHILDCLQINNFILNKSSTILDLGTGAGLPGIILSICGFENVSLVDSNLKKINFIGFIKKELNLPFYIINSRIEKLSNLKFDFIVSRALAKLNNLLFYSLPLSHRRTQLIFLKGRTLQDEILYAKKLWTFNYYIKESLSDKRGAIIIIDNFYKKNG